MLRTRCFGVHFGTNMLESAVGRQNLSSRASFLVSLSSTWKFTNITYTQKHVLLWHWVQFWQAGHNSSVHLITHIHMSRSILSFIGSCVGNQDWQNLDFFLCKEYYQRQHTELDLEESSIDIKLDLEESSFDIKLYQVMS